MEDISLPEHERHSEQRFQRLEEDIHHLKEKAGHHGHGGHEGPKVNFFTEGSSKMDGSAWAAILPALAQNRTGNDFAAILPALMAERRGGAGDCGALGGLGTGFIGGALGGLLFDRLGHRGGDCEGGGAVTANLDSVLTQKTLGEIKYDVATSANETQAVVNSVGSNGVQTTLQQTIALQAQAFAAQLANAQAFAATQDVVQRTAAINLQATTAVGTQVQTTGCEIKGVVRDENEKTRALIVRQYEDSLNRKLTEQAAELAELRAEGRNQSSRDAIRIEMINNQNQLQAQQQQQGFVVSSIASALAGLTQIAHATNQNIIAGNTGAVATGPQSANPTNVNTR